MFMTTYKFLRCIVRDGWTKESSHRREVLEWYRGEDAEDLKRSELNYLVENLACLNALERKLWKRDQKVTDEKINPKILMDEKKLENLDK